MWKFSRGNYQFLSQMPDQKGCEGYVGRETVNSKSLVDQANAEQACSMATLRE